MGAFTKFGAYKILEMVNSKISSVSTRFHIPTIISFVAAIAVMFVIGLAGFYLFKLIVSGSYGVAGVLFGAFLFRYVYGLQKHQTFAMRDLPIWGLLAAGIIIGLLFFFLTWKRTTYAYYAVLFIGVYYLAAHYLNFKWYVTLAAAGAIALLGIYLFKASVLVLTSFGASTFIINFCSKILPKVKGLQLTGSNKEGLILVFCLGMLFMLIQLFTTRRYKVK